MMSRMERVTARQLLAAFSAFGGPSAVAVPPEADGASTAETTRYALGELLFRISALAALHGPTAPRELLKSLALVESPAGAGAVDIVLSFLEAGRAPDGTGRNGGLLSDLLGSGTGGLPATGDGPDGFPGELVDPRAAPSLPPPLRALCELFTLVRSRLPRRPPASSRPLVAASSLIEQQVDDTTVLISPPDLGFALVIVCERLDLRRTVAAGLRGLLDRLTPSEAAWVLWAYVHQERQSEAVDFLLVTHDGALERLNWSYRGSSDPGDSIRLCLERLPSVERIAEGTEILLAGDGNPVIVRATAASVGEITVERMIGHPVRGLVCSGHSTQSPKPWQLPARAAAILDGYRRANPGTVFQSLACGLVHLNRVLGPEQEAGAAIGAELTRRLVADQLPVPLVAAEMYDDHALVRLAPRVYRAYLKLRLAGPAVAVIPRSSPVLRAIAAVLYHRLLTRGLGERVQRQGDSLYVDLGDGLYRELATDFRTPRGAGGLLLDTALLVYRTAPDRFDAGFLERFGPPGDVHRAITDLLDQGYGHLETARRMAELHRAFAPVTDLESTDGDVLSLVEGVLSEVHSGVVHVNVLNDYYVAHQDRVRALVSMLGLPLRLVSLHFSTANGQVSLHT